MIACDTNILFPALEASHPDHGAARAWLESMVGNESFALCELVLTEVYTLLRNAAICAEPLSAAAAVALIENLRGNPPLARARPSRAGSDGQGVGCGPPDRVSAADLRHPAGAHFAARRRPLLRHGQHPRLPQLRLREGLESARVARAGEPPAARCRPFIPGPLATRVCFPARHISVATDIVAT